MGQTSAPVFLCFFVVVFFPEHIKIIRQAPYKTRYIRPMLVSFKFSFLPKHDNNDHIYRSVLLSFLLIFYLSNTVTT